MTQDDVQIRLLFVDQGSYHHEKIRLPAAIVGRYERLIDCLREDPEVLEGLYVDVARLCAAYVAEDDEDDSVGD